MMRERLVRLVRMLAVAATLSSAGCVFIGRTDFASAGHSPPAMSADSGGAAGHAPLADGWIRLVAPDAVVELQVLGSRGRAGVAGVILPVLPMPPTNYDGPSPWVDLTMRTRRPGAALQFDPAAVVLERPDGRRMLPLLVSLPGSDTTCLFVRLIPGPDSLARLSRQPRDAIVPEALPKSPTPSAIGGVTCLRLAFKLPPGTAHSYLLRIPFPVDGDTADPSAGGAVWIVCVRPRASWQGGFIPLAPLGGPVWTFLKTEGDADFRNCPTTPGPMVSPPTDHPPAASFSVTLAPSGGN